MFLVRFVVNLIILALELAMVAAAAYAGWRWPIPFALATGAIAFLIGLGLEQARLMNELKFYLGGAARPASLLVGTVALSEAAFKGLLAGLAALLTFSGTDPSRLLWTAIVFAACLFGGTSLLRWLSIRFGAIPARWGFFRLAPLLGFLFSLGITGLVTFKVLPATTLSDLTKRVVLDLPARPGIATVSELIFVFKQYFDAVIVSLIGTVMRTDFAQAVGVVLSVNMLTGFVAAVHAVIIAEIVKRLEESVG